MEKNLTSTNQQYQEKRPSWQLSRRERAVALVLVAAIITGTSLPGRIIVATSDSLDHRVFFRVPVQPARIERGDYLLFRLQGEAYRPFLRQGIRENDLLIKQVGCTPGALLRRDKAGVFSCDQSRLGQALATNSQGERLPVFAFTGPVPNDSYFMVGTNPRSFDSRYFGFIHGDAFLAQALPIW